MRELVAMFESAGCSAVQTYIQSGNVVFESLASPEMVAAEVRERISAQRGYEIPIVMRSVDSLAATIAAMPYDPDSDLAKHFSVGFFDALPNSGRVASLDPDRSPPDSFTVHGQEVYLHCPNGGARTRLSHAWFESQLKVRCTMRNWNTVLRLQQLCET